MTLGLDEVDKLFQYPNIYPDFFDLLRSLHDEAKLMGIWQKLRLVIAYSTEIYVPLDINRSPFNVGFPICLPEFSCEQVLYLAQRHQLNWSDEQVKQLMSIVGGHPFLVRLALYHIARKDATASTTSVLVLMGMLNSLKVDAKTIENSTQLPTPSVIAAAQAWEKFYSSEDKYSVDFPNKDVVEISPPKESISSGIKSFKIHAASDEKSVFIVGSADFSTDIAVDKAVRTSWR